MTNLLIKTKIKERLNKLASFDFDNIEDWQIIEAFNKFQLEFASSEAQKAEQTKKEIEAIQVLLTPYPLKGTNRITFFETLVLPDDFLSLSRVSAQAKTDECPERDLVLYLAEESAVDSLLGDAESCPSFEWAETLYTMAGNRIKIYTDKKFHVVNPFMMYYRKPRPIAIAGSVDPSTGDVISKEITCEFKDDITEKLVDGAAAILAGDIESFNQLQRNLQNAQP